MGKLTITGGSEDLISITGDIKEEINIYELDDLIGQAIAVSDGTLLSVDYDSNGIWRFNVVKNGQSFYNKVEGNPIDDTFDVITLTWEKPFEWVVFGDLAT